MPVYKDKNKHWYFVVTIDYKQYKRTKWQNQYMLSKQEALNCEREFIKQLGLATSELTLYGLYDEFISSTKSTLKASSFFTYVKFKRNYLIYIKDKPINELTINDISRFKNQLNKKDCSIAHKNRCQNILKEMLEYGAIAYDLKARLQLPLLEPFKENKVKDITNKEKWLKIADFNLLIKPLEINSYWYVAINTLYKTGLRIGELAALQKKDIANNTMSINKDYIRVDGKDYIQPPKSTNSIRIVPLDPATYKMLLEFTSDMQPNDFIFNIKKKYLCQQELRRVLKRLQDEAKLESYKITPHTLRHSYSSNLKQLGFNEYIIAKLMGNTPEVASSTYIHADINITEITLKLQKLE